VVRAIAAAQGARLDVAYARDRIAALERALGQSDLMPLFEDATRLD
jgi:hypothetical protein